MRNVLTTVVKYSEITSTILTEATQRKLFANDSTNDAWRKSANNVFVVQSSIDRLNNQGRSSSWTSINQQSRSKSSDNWICNYCKNIKTDFCAFKAKNNKAQWAYQKSDRQEEVNYVTSSVKVFSSNPNILFVEHLVESEVLFMTSTWLLDSDASYHATIHKSQFGKYSAL